MEVKNPLFLDDPTPVVKDSAAAATSVNKNQSQPQQSNEKPNNSGPATKK